MTNSNVHRAVPGSSSSPAGTILLCLLLLLITPAMARAQHHDIVIKAYPSSWYNGYFEPGFDGMSIGYAYHPIINKSMRYNIFGELAVHRARNEFLAGFGINRTFWQADHFRLSLEANLLSGVNLYRPIPMYVGGLEGGIRFDYYLKKKLTLFLGIAARGTLCPGYRDIGPWKYGSWPVSFGIRF